MKAVIYARGSSNNQQGMSLEGQIRECTAYAQKNDIQIVGEYTDRAKSGTQNDRPDFQRMINDVSDNKFDCIIVWNLDRFTRNRHDFAHYYRILKNNNIRLICVAESLTDGSEDIA